MLIWNHRARASAALEMLADARAHHWSLSVDLKKQRLQSITLRISVMLMDCAAVILQTYIISGCDHFKVMHHLHWLALKSVEVKMLCDVLEFRSNAKLGSMCKNTPLRGIPWHQDRCLTYKSFGPRSSFCGVKVGIDGSMQVLGCCNCDLSRHDFVLENCRTNPCIRKDAKISSTSCISRKNWTEYTPINWTASRQNFWTQMLSKRVW